MYSFLILLSSIIAVVLMVVVLMQASKGEGLSGTFGGAGGSMGSMFGTRRTADFLSKATWWLGGSLAVLAIVVNLFFLPGQSAANQKESIIQQSTRPHVPQSPSLPQQNPTNTQTQGQPGAQPNTK
jgi:preprotein translocase subunit SecG